MHEHQTKNEASSRAGKVGEKSKGIEEIIDDFCCRDSLKREKKRFFPNSILEVISRSSAPEPISTTAASVRAKDSQGYRPHTKSKQIH